MQTGLLIVYFLLYSLNENLAKNIYTQFELQKMFTQSLFCTTFIKLEHCKILFTHSFELQKKFTHSLMIYVNRNMKNIFLERLNNLLV